MVFLQESTYTEKMLLIILIVSSVSKGLRQWSIYYGNDFRLVIYGGYVQEAFERVDQTVRLLRSK